MTCSIIAGGNSLRGFHGPFIGKRIFVNFAWKYFVYDENKDSLVCWDKITAKIDENWMTWPKYETIDKFGGKWIPKGNELRRDAPYVAKFNTTVALAINIAFHWGYDKIYLLGVDGFIKGPWHFYDDFEMSEKDQHIWDRTLKGRDGGLGTNGKIEVTSKDLDVIGVESSLNLPTNISLDEYSNHYRRWSEPQGV